MTSSEQKKQKDPAQKDINFILSLLSSGKFTEAKKEVDNQIINFQEQIVNLQTEDNTRSCIISDHAARDLLAISDRAIVLANTKIIADGKPSELLNNEKAKSLYFGSSFQIY